MSNITDKTAANAFYKARVAASKHNEQLSSREGAADIMAIDRGRLYRIENGIANPYPEEIHLMADLYHAPELRNYYCTEICPLGADHAKVEATDLDRIIVKAAARLQKIAGVRDKLLEITEDGVIDDEERKDLNGILEDLDKMEQTTQELKCWVRRSLAD